MKQYTWAEVSEERLNPLVTRRMIHTGAMTIAKIGMAKGAAIPRHSHENEQVTMLESGLMLFRMDDREITLQPGDALEIPPHVAHSVEALEDCVATDIFQPRREDWIRGDDAYLRR